MCLINYNHRIAVTQDRSTRRNTPIWWWTCIITWGLESNSQSSQQIVHYFERVKHVDWIRKSNRVAPSFASIGHYLLTDTHWLCSDNISREQLISPTPNFWSFRRKPVHMVYQMLHPITFCIRFENNQVIWTFLQQFLLTLWPCWLNYSNNAPNLPYYLICCKLSG